jgi:TolB protein
MVNCRPLAFVLILTAAVGWVTTAASAQPPTPDVTLEAHKTGVQRLDLLVGSLRVQAGGMPAAEAAALVEQVFAQDLLFSGFFRVARTAKQAAQDSLNLAYEVTGTVQLGDPGSPATIDLNLVTYPGAQPIINKRYRPARDQLRVAAHHFANEVMATLTGEPGIALTRVVFSRGTGDRRDLWVVDYDGENLMRLTANRTLNLCPSWRPDAEAIAFTSYHRGEQGLYLLETASGKVKQIISQQGLNLGASWSPDGKEILLSLSHPGNPEIFRITPAGDIVARLTAMPSIEVSPCWSPGGQDIVFTSDRTGTPQLYICDRDGAGRRRLTYEGKYNESAAWSPSGQQIVYATREVEYTQLVLIAATGEDRRLLTDRRWRNCEDPGWAPDSRHFVFASDRTGTFKLYVMDILDGNVRQLTFGNEPDITPAWSPR